MPVDFCRHLVVGKTPEKRLSPAIALKYASLVSRWWSFGHFLKLTRFHSNNTILNLRHLTPCIVSCYRAYPQNGDRIVTTDSVTSLRSVCSCVFRTQCVECCQSETATIDETLDIVTSLNRPTSSEIKPSAKRAEAKFALLPCIGLIRCDR